MTIRKITGATTSTVAKATAVRSGIFKATAVTQSGIKRIEAASNLLIPKIANTTTDAINHLLYDPLGRGLRNLRDYLSEPDLVSLLLTKSLTPERVDVTESLNFSIGYGLRPSDVQNILDSEPVFLIRASRTFADDAAAVSRPYLLLAKAPILENVNPADFFLITRVVGIADQLDSADQFRRIVQSFRLFQDETAMLDSMGVFDGSTFSIYNTVRDVVTIGTPYLGTTITTSGSVGGSAVFNGTNATWRINTSSAFTYGTNDFTIEFWGYQTSGGGVQGIQRTSTGDATFSSGFCTITQPAGRLTITQGTGTSNLVITSNTTIAFNTWHHYAYVRNGTSFKLYVDGVAQTSTFNYAAAIPPQVGYMQFGNAGGLYAGRLTNIRIVNGTAVYTSNFTPPTTPLTAIANTQLLMLMTSSGTLTVDSSPNNFNVYAAGGTPTFSTSTPLTASTGTEVGFNRFSGDQLENISYWFDKPTNEVITLNNERMIFDIAKTNIDAIDALETISNGLLKTLADSTIMLDNMALGDNIVYDSGKLIADNVTASHAAPTKYIGTVKNDNAQIAAISSYKLLKYLADETLMLDNMTLGDNIVYDNIKRLFDTLVVTEDQSFYAGMRKSDTSTAAERIFKRVETTKADTANTVEQLYKLFFRPPFQETVTGADDFGKFLQGGRVVTDIVDTMSEKFIFDATKLIAETQPLDERLNKLVLKPAADDQPIVDERVVQWYLKQLADIAAMEDTTGLFDGLMYSQLLNKQDDQPVVDYFARSVTFFRRPDQGFADPATPIERIYKYLNLDAKAGTYTNVQLRRTNHIPYSEQFEYWTKNGTTIETSPPASPPGTVQRNIVYDAAQVAEVFDSDNGYYKWYQLAPLQSQLLRSSADFIVEDTSTGEHSINIFPVSVPFLDGITFKVGISIYVKAAGRNLIELYDGVNSTVFNLSSTTVVTTPVGAEATIAPVGDGWARCTVVSDISAYPLAYVKLLDSSGSSTYTGNGVSGAYVYAAQLEFGDQLLMEFSSLGYLPTVGSPVTAFGYNQMPRERDRVFVGSLHRQGGVRRLYGDPYETLSFWMDKPPESEIIPLDYFARAVNFFRSGQQDATSPEGLDNFVVLGRPEGKRVSGSDVERTSYWFNKSAKLATTSYSTAYSVYRSNLIAYSESFTVDYWDKVGTITDTSLALMSGLLPYRDPEADADQLQSVGYIRPYTYYSATKDWYQIVRPGRRSSFTSNTLNYIAETETLDDHYIEAELIAAEGQDNYFSMSVYASIKEHGDRFRLSLGPVSADFSLSSGTVVSTADTVYTDITLIDSSLGVYLCKIIGPVYGRFLRLLSSTLTDVQVMGDASIYTTNTFRTFHDNFTEIDVLVADQITDYQSASGEIDFSGAVGYFDYQYEIDYPASGTVEFLEATPTITEILEDGIGTENMNL